MNCKENILVVFKAPRKHSEMVKAFPDTEDKEHTYFRMPNDLDLLKGKLFNKILFTPNSKIFPKDKFEELLESKVVPEVITGRSEEDPETEEITETLDEVPEEINPDRSIEAMNKCPNVSNPVKEGKRAQAEVERKMRSFKSKDGD